MPPLKKIRKMSELSDLLRVKCCNKFCLRNFSLNDIRSCETQFKEQEQTEQRNWLLQYLHTHTSTSTEEIKYDTQYIIKGKVVCKEAWMLASDIKADRFRRVSADYREGKQHYVHGRSGKKKKSLKSEEAVAWLQSFVSILGNSMPHSKKTHLPSCFTKISLYRKMEKELKEKNVPVIGTSQFYHLWDECFPDVIIPKENLFTKCSDCTKYKKELEKCTDKKERQNILKLLDDHLELVMQERRKYHLHRYKSRRHPSRYMCIIVDGMDQSKTQLPKIRRVAKDISGLKLLRTHLVGAINHSGLEPFGKQVYAFIDLFQWPHDSNLTANVLLRVLHAHKNNLPPTLYLQMDNCYRENKNQYILCFLAVLIEKKIFDKIRGNFLPVGHTHEDIDAFFGNLSQFLGHLDVQTIKELLQAITACSSNPFPKSTEMSEMFDVKSWVSPHIKDGQIHEHTTPLCFKFERDEHSGKAQMFYRHWSHEDWMGPVEILSSVPEAAPKLVRPTSAKMDLEALTKDIPKFNSYLSNAAIEEWTQWIENIAVFDAEKSSSTTWFLDDLKVRNGSTQKETDENVGVSEELLVLRRNERAPINEIYTGPRRGPSTRKVIEVEDHKDLQKEDLVVVELENWNGPVIGKVLEIFDESSEFLIHYLDGKLEGKWTLQFHRESGRTVPYTDRLPKQCIRLFAFKLRKDGKLPLTTIRKLKLMFNV